MRSIAWACSIPPLLSALHRGTVIDIGTLDPMDAGLQSLRIAKFRAAVRQDIFGQGEKLTSPHTLSQAVKNKAYSPLLQRFIRKARKS